MSKSSISSRLVANRIALFVVIASFLFLFMAAGTKAAGFSIIDSVKGLFGMQDRGSASNKPAAQDQTSTSANAGEKGKGLFQRTVSNEEAFPYYDIRDQADGDVADTLVGYRQAAGKNASAVANIRDKFVQGENELKASIPTLKVDYNTDIRTPEIIGTDVLQGRTFLTSATKPAGQKHAEVLLDFLRRNTSLVGTTARQVGALKVFADYTNPDGNLSWVELDQEINGVPVFRGEVKAGFTKSGEMIRVVNNFAPGLDYEALSKDFGDPAQAVRYAAPLANYELKSNDTVPNRSASSDIKVKFGTGGDWDITAEKMYFPTEPGVAVPSWRVLIWKPVNAYYVIVDAHNGTMLWRKNITNDQTQPATYNVYANTTSMVNALDNPAPLTPGPLDPTLGTQGILQTRTNVTLIGNEAPNPGQDNLGWITDGVNAGNGWTDGNNVQAGLDIDGVNGVDAPQNGTGRVFNFAYNAPPGNPTPGDPPSNALNRSGAITQLFYYDNRYHDVTYSLGFTELARNFQNDNFGRGGVAADRVSGEAQDSSGTNNANFSTPADGGRGRMQMYIFTNSPVNRDGDIDGDVVLHEHTHGLSNRLIGNGSGLGTTRSGGMGEGWSDFYGGSLLSEPTDPVNGIYTTGSYVTYQVSAFGVTTNNYYYGIRRLPYAPIGFTGGPQNRPFNPITAGDVNTGCNISNGAFPPLANGGACNEVHNEGEVWASMLYEARAKFETRLGQAVGNKKMLQIVTDGMKLSPLNPTFQSERDSIIAAANASALAPEAALDSADVWSGMALRGMGVGATDNGTTVVESFVAPGARMVDPFSVNDSTGNNNGYPEPGEPLLLTIAVNNSTGATVNNVVVNVTGGGSVNYGDIANGQTVTNDVPYTVPSSAPCGSLHVVSIDVVSTGLGTNTTTKNFRLGVPSVAPATFTNSAAITIPAGAPTTTNGPGTPYPSTITVAGLSGNKNVKVKFNQLSHTTPGDMDMLLVGPGNQKMEILSDQGGTTGITNVDLTLTDTAIATIGPAIVAGEFKPAADPGQDAFVSPAPGPVYLLPAPGGTATLTSAFGTNGANMNGDWKLFIVDDTANNVGSMAGGWSLIFESTDATCAFGGSPTPTSTPINTPTSTPTGTPAATISGTVTYGNALIGPSPRPVSNATISGAGSPNVSTTTSFPDGTYSLTGFGAGAYTVTPTKTTGINNISAFDAAKIAQHVTGVATLTGNQLIVADVSGNGSISSFDAAEVAAYAASVQPTGSTGTWKFSPVSRPYASVTTNITGQDYSALLMGEVSGNWNDTGARPAEGPQRSTAITAPHLVTPADDEVLIPVRVEGAADKGIISYEFDLRYDPSVIQPQANPVDIAGTVSSKLSVAANAEEAGLLRVAVYGPMPIGGNGVLLNLRFTAVGAPGSVSGLTWERFMLNEGDPGTTATDGQVELSAATPNQAEINGRLLTGMGQGVANARVTLTDTTGQSRSVLSNGFGVYRFGGLQVGQTYTIRAGSKGYNFTPLMVSVTGQLASVDVIAEQ